MIYLISQFWMWLLAALVIGLIAGFAFARHRPGYGTGDGRFWIAVYAVLIIAGAVVAGMRLVKGSGGLWFDTLLLFAVAYVLGCLIGALLQAATAGEGGEAALAGAALSAPLPKQVASPLPPASPPVADEDRHPGRRPPGFTEAIAAAPDNLKLISGIGHQNEERLNALGIWHFSQIAAWTKDNIDWVGSYLAFPGRIEREQWVEQARKLAAGQMTDFAQRAARGEVPTSRG